MDLVGNGGGWLLPAMRLAVMNFVSEVIDEARNGAVCADGPSGPDVEESRGIEIQRIRVLPVDAEIIADVLAAGSDGHPPPIIDVGHSGAVAAGLLCRELPGLAIVEGISRNLVWAAGFLVVAAHCHDQMAVTESKGEDPGGGFATGDGVSAMVHVCPRSCE